MIGLLLYSSRVMLRLFVLVLALLHVGVLHGYNRILNSCLTTEKEAFLGFVWAFIFI